MTPLVLRTNAEVAAFSADLWKKGQRLALVPTMGFLHEGHLSLMREGEKRAEVVAASIFVNPTQFGPKEDLNRYPRDVEGDLAKCGRAGVKVVFVPEAAEVYPHGYQTFVEVTDVSRGLCGERRPGHFRVVATVVTKLLCLFRPQVALFGEKDFQQLQVIRALVRDLNLGVSVVGMPTLREPDGLAMSSRNAYLSAEDRARGLSLYRGLLEAQRLAGTGVGAVPELLAAIRGQLSLGGVREDYVEIVDAETLRPLTRLDESPSARALVAGYVGSTRLIDNVALH